VLTNAHLTLAEEATVGGISIIQPIIIVNYIAFIAFWCLIFTNFRKTLYPEQDILVLIAVSLTILSVLLLSTIGFTIFN
jgi:hypothetical protein